MAPSTPTPSSRPNNLAVTRYELGDAEGVRELHEGVYEARRRLLGPEHPDTLISTHNLAVTRYALGHAEGARRLHEDTRRWE